MILFYFFKKLLVLQFLFYTKPGTSAPSVPLPQRQRETVHIKVLPGDPDMLPSWSRNQPELLVNHKHEQVRWMCFFGEKASHGDRSRAPCPSYTDLTDFTNSFPTIYIYTYTCVCVCMCVCVYIYIYIYFFFFAFLLFKAVPAAYGGFQARGQIVVTAVSWHHSHSNAGPKLRLGPTPQLMATSDP